MTEETTLSVNFIGDEPSSSDEFIGQPHARIAETLVATLRSGDGGRAIGLEGTWGSGKSTVVDIARSQLDQENLPRSGTKKHTFFIFDIWSHHGDPIRRVFLQELIRHLGEGGAIKMGEWQEKLDRLDARQRKVIETKDERLSPVAKAIALLLPISPLIHLVAKSPGGVFADVPWFDVPGIEAPLVPYWVFGVLVALVPYLVALYVRMSWSSGYRDIKSFLRKDWRLAIRPWSNSWWKRKEGFESKSVIWAFARQTDEVTTEQLIEENEATTFEFNRVFDQLVESVAENEGQLVIVFDNIDRLSSDLLRSVWATMRNFFASSPGSKRQDILKSVWLIVPFDRKHIESVFESNEKTDAGVTPGLVEKTFEIVLRVAPPILSNWQDFLAKKLEEAFHGVLTDQEVYDIFKLFELYHRQIDVMVTPRMIKSFVNKMAAQGRQWGRTIPLEHQALFVLLKEDIESGIAALQDGSLLDPFALAGQVANAQWQRSLAAAHYNVPPDHADELLWSAAIQQNLSSANLERLVELSKSTGFWLTLRNIVIEDGHAWAQAGELPSRAGTLSQIPVDDENIAGDIWRSLSSRVRGMDGKIVYSTAAVVGLGALVRNAPDSTRGGVEKKILSVLSEQPADNPSHVSGKNWYELVAAVVNAAGDSHDGDTPIAIPADPVHTFGVAAADGMEGAVGFSRFAPQSSPEDVAAHIVSLIQSEELNIDLEAALASFTEIPKRLDWNAVSESIRIRLNTSDPKLDSVTSLRLLQLLNQDSWIPKKAASSALNALIDDGSIHGLVGLARAEKNETLRA